jgi:hypothetical protein
MQQRSMPRLRLRRRTAQRTAALAVGAIFLGSSLSWAGYETQLLSDALNETGRVVDAAPAGKNLEEIILSSHDVLSRSDPLPLFLNHVHVQTRNEVLQREILFHVGERYSEQMRQETERNLRRLFYIAVARVVPVKGLHGGVAMLVVTKDKWSLRLSNSFTLIGSLLQYLQLQLTEVNFNGRGQELALGLLLKLDTFSVGQNFKERRLFGSLWNFSESVNVILNRNTKAFEGTNGIVSVGRPFVSLSQAWAFQTYFSWNSRTARVFRGSSIWQVPVTTASGLEYQVPFVYPMKSFQGEAAVTRRLGSENKLDLTAALGAYSRNYLPASTDALPEDQRDALAQRWLPRSESATNALFRARAFSARYVVLKNIDAFELSEDFQLGFLLNAGARVAIPNPLTPLFYLELAGSARYRFYSHDNVLTLSSAAQIRLRPNDTSANRRFSFEVSDYSPQFYGGRFVARILADFIVNDLDNRQLFLGGSDGLRGTFAEEFSGRNQVLGNFEFRVKPLEIFSTWLGFVMFFDVGAASNGVLQPTSTTGFGVRWLIPQFNNEVIRIDFGMVLGGPQPGFDRLNASWGQVTNLHPSFLDDPI